MVKNPYIGLDKNWLENEFIMLASLIKTYDEHEKPKVVKKLHMIYEALTGTPTVP